LKPQYELEWKNYYDILKVPNGCDNESLIKNQYRKLAQIVHPDANPDLGDKLSQDINVAYEYLSDPGKRAAYWLYYQHREETATKERAEKNNETERLRRQAEEATKRMREAEHRARQAEEKERQQKTQERTERDNETEHLRRQVVEASKRVREAERREREAVRQAEEKERQHRENLQQANERQNSESYYNNLNELKESFEQMKMEREIERFNLEPYKEHWISSFADTMAEVFFYTPLVLLLKAICAVTAIIGTVSAIGIPYGIYCIYKVITQINEGIQLSETTHKLGVGLFIIIPLGALFIHLPCFKLHEHLEDRSIFY